MRTLKTVAIIVAAIIAIGAVSIWSAKRDVKIMEGAVQYEKCVRTEYNTTPSAYYAENGEYPYCKF